jgi:hypothetical protein
MTKRVAGAVLALVVVTVAVVVVARSGGSSVAATMRAAGCTYRDVPPYPP